MEQRCIHLEGTLKKSQFELQQKTKQVRQRFVTSVGSRCVALVSTAMASASVKTRENPPPLSE